MKNYLLLLVLAASFTISSCGNDDDEPAPTPATPAPTTVTVENPFANVGQGSTDPAIIQFTKEMLTGTDWEMTAMVKGVENTANFRDVYKDLPACQREDIYNFNSSGNALTVSEGIFACNLNTQSKTGTWAMPNSAKLTITATGLTQPGLTGEFTILQLSETTLVLQQKANGFIYVSTFEPHTPPSAMLQMLVNVKWKLTAEDIFNFGATFDNYASMPTCMKDDFMIFGGNGDLTVDEGSTKCTSTAPQTRVQPYDLYGNYLFINGSQYYINEITPTKLVLIYYSSGGSSYTRTSTYTKI